MREMNQNGSQMLEMRRSGPQYPQCAPRGLDCFRVAPRCLTCCKAMSADPWHGSRLLFDMIQNRPRMLAMLQSGPQLENNAPRKLKCSIHEITDMKEHPSNLSTEEILVRSSNVGSVILAQKIGEDIFKKFIKNTNLIKAPDIELEEVGVPHEI